MIYIIQCGMSGITRSFREDCTIARPLYHVASAVALAWEGGRIHEMRGDARRLLLSRMAIDHRVLANDPFRLTENSAQRAITGHFARRARRRHG
jgi:hypothetical protein